MQPSQCVVLGHRKLGGDDHAAAVPLEVRVSLLEISAVTKSSRFKTALSVIFVHTVARSPIVTAANHFARQWSHDE